MITGSAALNAARAALRSPLWIASSTLRTEFRSTERRALLILVRTEITLSAFLSDVLCHVLLCGLIRYLPLISHSRLAPQADPPPKRLGFTRSCDGGRNRR